MKKNRAHITRLLSALLLMVFSIALTPWSALHHHEPQPVVKAEKNCTHKVHVQSHGDTCLICAAHFEKNYVNTHSLYKVYLSVKLFTIDTYTVKGTYTEIKNQSLRGPPVV